MDFFNTIARMFMGFIILILTSIVVTLVPEDLGIIILIIGAICMFACDKKYKNYIEEEKSLPDFVKKNRRTQKILYKEKRKEQFLSHFKRK